MTGTINSVKGPFCLVRRSLHLIIPLILLASVWGCAFTPPSATLPMPPFTPSFENVPLSPVVDSGEQKVFEEPDNMVVYHGFACAESNDSDHQTVLRIEQSRAIPATMNRATVFLNGWRFKYLNGEHKILGLGTSIFKIRVENNELKWEAGGVIGDHNFDDPYRWCYRYTLIAWNQAVFTAGPDHRDVHTFRGDNAAGWETALSFHPTYTSTTLTGEYGPTNAAILPRGFGFFWADQNDNNLLQLAYNLDYSERFVADGKRYVSGTIDVGGADAVDQAATSFHTWETKTIFKDNSLKRDYGTAEIVSVLAGPGIGVVQPPFTIVPVEDKSNCVAFGDPESESRTISQVPFDIAIPVLTGWDLSYVCDDEPVEEIGIWIDSFEYTGPAGGPGGLLKYTIAAVLHDQDRGNANRFRHRVSILGFNRVPGVIAGPSLESGPRFVVTPSGPLSFPYPLTPDSPDRFVYLDNYGDEEGDRTTIAITGADAGAFRLASQHAPERTIPPQGVERFHLTLTSPYFLPTNPSGTWRAKLEIGTSAGTLEVPLVGSPIQPIRKQP
jgi:hypothetical protein